LSVQKPTRLPARVPTHGAATSSTVQAALSSIATEPEVDASAPVVLLGFSQGASTAASIIRKFPNVAKGAVFVGANVRFTKAELTAAGISKIGYAAGQYDGTYPYLLESNKRLVREEFASQFRSLGKVAHTYYGESEALSLDALVSWIAED
jgi:predicted esterase